MQFKHPNKFQFIKCQASDIRVTVTRKKGRKYSRKEGVRYGRGWGHHVQWSYYCGKDNEDGENSENKHFVDTHMNN